MDFSIRVQKSPEYLFAETHDLLTKDFNIYEELRSVVNLCDNKRRIDCFEALVIPVRTNTINNFCKDFFLPTFFNHALKIDDIAVKILLSISFLPLDIFTLPLRLITVIPRYIYNSYHSKENHPFYQYLISNGVPAEDLTADHIYLKVQWIEGRRGWGAFEDDRNLVTQGDTFNFIQLPKGESLVRREFGRRGLPDQQELQGHPV